MAIAYDSGIYAQAASATSLTFAFNNAAGDCMYVMGYNNSGTNNITSVTYNGTNLTQIANQNGAAGRNDRAVDSWRLVAPATGSHNVVVTASASTVLRYSAASYSGVDQTTPENGTTTGDSGGTATSYSVAITTTADNCWMASMSKDRNGAKTYTSTTGDTIRLNTDAGGSLYVDTGAAITPAGSNTMTVTMASVDGIGGVAWAIRPAVASQVSAIDGVSQANITSFLGVANASISSVNGIANS